jgi:hypothetical protein
VTSSARTAESVADDRGGADVSPPFWSGRWWTALFPVAPARPVGAVRALVAAVLVLGGTAVSLARTGGAGPFNSIWAEDATNFLSDSLDKHVWTAVFTPFNGYYHLLPRLLTGAAKEFGVAWMPAVMSVEAALVISLLALTVYLAGGSHLSGVVPRLLVCLPLVAGPIYGSVPNNVATLQFSLIYGGFWMLLWTPARWVARLVAVAVLFATAASTILAVVLVPLALLRLYARRDRWSVLAAGGFLAVLCLQVVPQVLGLNPRGDISHPRFQPLWALREYVGWALPREVVGQHWSGLSGLTPLGQRTAAGDITYTAAILIGWAVLLCALLAALTRLTRPDWRLAGVAFASSVFTFVVAVMLHGSVQYRYALSSGLILLVALAAMLRPRPDRPAVRASVPVAVLLALSVAVGVANLRYPDFRDHSYPWNDLVRQATAQCRTHPHHAPVVTLTGRVGPWHAVLPCRYLVQ